MQDLFREQAIQYQRQGFHGRIVLSRPASFAAISIAVCAACMFIVAFMWLVSIPRTTTASGVLVQNTSADTGNATLAAVLTLPARQAVMIRSGAAVALQFSDYPPEVFGVQSGNVSSSELVQQDASKLHRVRVQLRTPTLHAADGAPLLKAGMSTTAIITLEQRRLIDWVLSPLTSATEQAQ